MRPVSIHTASWRYPGGFADANFNFGHLKRFIQKLEQGRFDAFFMADHLAVMNMPMEALKRSLGQGGDRRKPAAKSAAKAPATRRKAAVKTRA